MIWKTPGWSNSWCDYDYQPGKYSVGRKGTRPFPNMEEDAGNYHESKSVSPKLFLTMSLRTGPSSETGSSHVQLVTGLEMKSSWISVERQPQGKEGQRPAPQRTRADLVLAAAGNQTRKEPET